MRALLAALVLLLGAMPAFAVNPDEVLADPALEARARAISENLRCLVCQNQSIDDSDADLARDLRIIVRERLSAGDTDQQAVQFIVDRYGEYVLLNPVVAPHTILLWIAAPVVLVIGGIVVFAGARRKRAAVPAAELTDNEKAALDKLQEPQTRA
jgi:cytochrome c-type biogenesis protein CcmH